MFRRAYQGWPAFGFNCLQQADGLAFSLVGGLSWFGLTRYEQGRYLSRRQAIQLVAAIGFLALSFLVIKRIPYWLSG